MTSALKSKTLGHQFTFRRHIAIFSQFHANSSGNDECGVTFATRSKRFICRMPVAAGQRVAVIASPHELLASLARPATPNGPHRDSPVAATSPGDPAERRCCKPHIDPTLAAWRTMRPLCGRRAVHKRAAVGKNFWSRRQESNLYLALRRHSFYPLNYGERQSNEGGF